MSTPKVSVLIPTYNYARYLPETIESVLTQDFTDFELIISDDASTDHSANIIRHYAEKDPRIRFVLHQKNLGMVQNWNWCLCQARGDYIKFVFGDDRLASPSALVQWVRMLDQNPAIVLAASARWIIDESSRPVDYWNHMNPSGNRHGHNVIARCLAANQNLIGEPTAVIFRRRDAGRGFNPDYRQIVDMEMWFHLLEKGELAYTSEPLCSFRRHENQQTAVNRGQNVGRTEGVQLFKTYFDRPWIHQQLTRKDLFRCAYSLQKTRKTGIHTDGLEIEIKKTLGRGWYYLYWCRHKIVRPFINLRNTLHKRLKAKWLGKVNSIKSIPIV